ncbi:ricin B lectin domain-containing protein [Mycena floridula]|nr:ricin B lectin domain-containing protein [Mycena floridula]KAJ7573397.1 ricin B lectin domain-containing protein [Mycena floridula]
MPVPDGTYRIYNVDYTLNLDLQNYNTKPGTHINGHTPNGATAQNWVVQNTGANGVKIRSILAQSGQNVYVTSTAVIQGAGFVSGMSYTFHLEETDSGVYYIKSSDGNNLVATHPSAAPTTQVIWSERGAGLGQLWRFDSV